MPRVSYEAASDIAEDAASHLISSRSQMLLYSQSGFLHFADRYYHEDGSELTPTEMEQIEDWASTAEHELMVPVSGGDTGVPTPFWDDATDLDDQETPEMQTWYGEVTDPGAAPDELTFVENAAIWIFTGFIAYSGDIGAAIVFHTVAPSFVLAWRAGDIGEIFRIVVDAADYGTVDTTGLSGDVVQRSIYADPDLSEHDIMLIKVS